MIKERKPLDMYETLETIESLKETDRSKDLKIFIKKFSKSTPAKAKKLRVALEALDIIKLKNSDIVKIIDIMPENAVELNKIFTEVSLDADETNKILDAIKNEKIINMKDKEEQAIVIDYLPYGYPLEKKMMPIAQAIGKKNLTLLELVPRRGIKLEVGEEVYIGEGKRDKVYYILGKLAYNKISENAKGFLQAYIEKQIMTDEKRFVDFFNTAQPINTRLHQLELIPGFGKKHTEAILKEREVKPFESFEDLKTRVSNLPDPKAAIVKRITEELQGEERHNVFIN